MKFPSVFSLGCVDDLGYSVTMWIVVMYLWGINALALLAFGWDKLRAGRRKRRIPERRLLWLAVLGGSPGAVLGRWIFRHKTRKSRFGFGLYAILCVQAGLVYFVLSGAVPSTFW